MAINPITGLEEEEVIAEPAPVIAPQEPAPMNPAVREYLTKKFDLGEYTDENRKKLADDQGPDFKDRLAGVFSAIGAAAIGKDASAAANQQLQSAEASKRAKLAEFDKGRAHKISQYQMGKEMDRETRYADPTSEESQLAQQLAVRMGYKGDPSAVTAERFKEFSPALSKLYEIEQKKLDRQFALNSKRDEARAKLVEKGSEGQRAVDRDYAKDYNDWTSQGKPSLGKHIESLTNAIDALEKDKSLSGGLTGVLGDRLTANRVLEQRQKVGSAIQGSLKATLGAQFTEKEGERILKNAYNEAASAETNKESLKRVLGEILRTAANNDKKAAYYEEYGTLKGFKSNPVGEQATEFAQNQMPSQASSAKPKTVMQNGVSYTLNEKTGEYE